MVMVGQAKDAADPEKGKYSLIRDAEDFPSGIYEKQLPCFGCFVFPLMWYYATVLYFGNYYRKDPRERAGLAASAIAVYLSLSFDYRINWHNCPIVAGTSLCCRAVDHSIVSDVLDLLNRKRASNIFTSMKKSVGLEGPPTVFVYSYLYEQMAARRVFVFVNFVIIQNFMEVKYRDVSSLNFERISVAETRT
ncbi:unnamed protein product [Malus baccata var. baccata]